MKALTWHQQQRKALGLPHLGAHPAALLITLSDAANPHLGAERRVLTSPVIDVIGTPEELIDAYHERILAVVSGSVLFDDLEKPQLRIQCVPAIDVKGHFADEATVVSRTFIFDESEPTPMRRTANVLDLRPPEL